MVTSMPEPEPMTPISWETMLMNPIVIPPQMLAALYSRVSVSTMEPPYSSTKPLSRKLIASFSGFSAVVVIHRWEQ
jgi:hypothetical protein